MENKKQTYKDVIVLAIGEICTAVLTVLGFLLADVIFETGFSYNVITGAFLGSALMMASTSGGALRGAILLGCYALGLGIPFLLSAVLLDGLQSAFRFIKQHYRIINTVSGIFLIVIGICMMLGWMIRIMALFS
jgi:cytochrome c-type biogenesis protein